MLEKIEHGDVHELRLARPPANALNPAMVQAITEALKETAGKARAVVVSGQPGMFSAGLDLPEMINFDREQLSRSWQSFLGMTKTIASMPVPTAFAITGHAPAGGIVMALFGDYRIMPRGAFKTGLNEVQVGLVVPAVIHAALARTVGAHTAERILVSGELMNPDRALAIGLVDELVDDPESAVSRAIEWCEQLLSLPSTALMMTRALARADLHALFDDSSALGVEKFVHTWFSESTNQTLKAVVDRLKNR